MEYSLTRHGESLKPILKLMSAWGSKHRARYGARVDVRKSKALANGKRSTEHPAVSAENRSAREQPPQSPGFRRTIP